ncbi:MAG: hypothetical protein GXO81_03020 [Chlorobi bacterium]|nr:hypothetical protein [Chlorobiota bacterium]
MDCFSEEFIQKYEDGESTENEARMAENHMAECIECKIRIERQKQRSIKLKKALNQLVDKMPEIPLFTNQGRQHVSLKRKLIYGMIAACILLLLIFVIGRQQTNNKKDYMLYYILDFEVDANKPITDQELIMYVIDQNGNITDCEYNSF